MPAATVYPNAFSGRAADGACRVREPAENPPFAPSAIEPGCSLDVCACAKPDAEAAEQSAAIPTATMVRAEIGMPYLGWLASGERRVNNKSARCDPTSHLLPFANNSTACGDAHGVAQWHTMERSR